MLLTKKGDLYDCWGEIKLQNSKVKKFKNNQTLRDGSKIEKYTRVEYGRVIGLGSICMAEAITSKGEKVLLSLGKNTKSEVKDH